MDVSPETWKTVSKLLDQALDLESEERAAWLDRLIGTHPDLVPLVRKLLAAHSTAGHADVLAHLPAISLTRSAAVAVSGLVSGALVGPYRLKREIGSGGMADLWLAERADGAFERDVALKLPRLTHLRRDLAERFAQERDILARLEHPYIARFYDAGISDAGQPFLAMEYVDGRPFIQWCDEHALGVVGRVQLLLQVLDAVQFAHRNLVIHRDLKPSNILVTQSGQVRLLDFGIAKLLAEGSVAPETNLTQFSGRALTPQYASPEQIRGDPLTTASDVYSIGVVLYELLTGQMPYRLAMSSAAQLEEAIVTAAPSRPSSAASATQAHWCGLSEKRLRRALAGDLDTIVLKALAKEPVQRYGSATDLALDLQRHLSGEPVHARPPSWRYRASTLVRRNKLAVGAASAIALTLVAGASISIWQAQRARAEAARAEEVKNFVLSIFEDADTARGGSRSTTALDLLRQARQRLDSAPVTDPNISAELLNALGYSLQGLGQYAEAVPVLEQAVQVADTRLGPDHATTISSRINLSGAYLSVGEQAQKAGSVISQALASARRSGDAKLLVEALRVGGSVSLDQGKMDEALERTKESAQLADSKLSQDTHTVLLAHWQYAAILWRQHSREAVEESRLTYELARKYWKDSSNADLLAARSFHAVVLADLQGDAQTALGELRAVREEQMRLFGTRSYTFVVRTNERIGLVSLMMGDPKSAIASYQEALQGETEQIGGADAVEIARNRMKLGEALLAARRFDEAEKELRDAGEIRTRLGQPPSPELALLLVAVLTHDGRLTEAELTLAPLLEHPPATPRDLAAFKRQLGQLRSAQGRAEEAVPILREAEKLYEKTENPDRVAEALATLGAAQLATGNAADALATLSRSDMLLEKVHPHGSPDHADLLIDIARAQLMLGHPADAVTAAARAAEFWTQFDAQNRQAGLAQLWHARALAQSRQELQPPDHRP